MILDKKFFSKTYRIVLEWCFSNINDKRLFVAKVWKLRADLNNLSWLYQIVLPFVFFWLCCSTAVQMEIITQSTEDFYTLRLANNFANIIIIASFTCCIKHMLVMNKKYFLFVRYYFLGGKTVYRTKNVVMTYVKNLWGNHNPHFS